jgi:hypothetical protein
LRKSRVTTGVTRSFPIRAAAGVYFVHLDAEGRALTRRVVLMR